MAFSVEDFHDLVRLLEQRPEWRTELRRLVLTEELLSLPAIVQDLAEAQQRTEQQVRDLVEAQQRTEQQVRALTEAQQRTEQQMGDLVEAQQRIEQEVRELAKAQQRTEQQVAGLRGDNLERRYRERATAYFGRLLRRVRVVAAIKLDQLLDEGLAAGTLDEDAVHDVRLTDLIVGGRRPGEDRDTYLVVEVSVAIDRDDVERATRRAAALGRLRPALAVVAGERLTPEAAALADARGVWRMLDGRGVEPGSAA